MTELFIDTSQAYLILALKTDKGLAEKIILHENQLGKILALSVQDLFASTKLPLNRLKKVSVGVGPGSYTGTRVGVAFAESLAFGLNIPLIKLPSLLFYLEPEETALALKSNFELYGCITLKGHIAYYTLQSHLPSPPPRILTPPLKKPSPHWPGLSKLVLEKPLDHLLYFSGL